MTKPADITAIIVSFESGSVISGCLKSLRDQCVNVIVVDNNSRDNSVALAQSAGVQTVVLPKNLGFGVANNLGAAQATTPWLMFINPDACLGNDAVHHLLQAISNYPQAGLFGARIIEPDGRIFFQPTSLLATKLQNPKGILHVPDGDCCLPFVSGACMIMRRDFFEKLGGFDPSIFLFYEDDDLCRRVCDVGKSIIWLNSVEICHLRGKSTTKY